jgi:hypothetical protein
MLIATTPHQHDASRLPVMTTAFGKRLDGCGTLDAHQRFHLLSIHDFSAGTAQPTQQGLIDGDNDPCGIHFPEPDRSILEKSR